MTPMTHTDKRIVDTYSLLFNNLSQSCKMALAEQLSKPCEKEQKAFDGFDLSFGAWEGAYQTTEEIKAEIKSNRQFKNKTPLFA
jgi:hypothetical protein